MNHRISKGIIGVLVGFTILVTTCTLAFSESRQEIIEKAKKEGELVLYWSLSSSVADKIIQEFNVKYPFIKVNRFQTTSFKMIARYYQEVIARRPTCDMISITDVLPYIKLYKEGNLLKYESPEWDRIVDLPKDYMNRGYWAPIRIQNLGVLVNTDIVDPKTIQSYDDVLQDKFKGKIAAGDVEHSDCAYPFYYALRKATNSTHYWKRLSELKAAVFTSSEKATEACVAGEWPVIFDIWTFRAFQYGVKKGAPVAAIIPKEGTVVIPGVNAIMKQASHPNAAKLMQDHLLTENVQKIMGEMNGYHPALKGMPPPPGLMDIKDAKVIPLNYEEAESLRDKWMADWKQIMNR